MVVRVTVLVNYADSVVTPTRRHFTPHTADLHKSVTITGFGLSRYYMYWLWHCILHLGLLLRPGQRAKYSGLKKMK